MNMSEKNESTSTFKNFKAMYEELSRAGYPDIKKYGNNNDYIKVLKNGNYDLETYIEIIKKWLPKIEYKTGGLLLIAKTDIKYDGSIIIPIFNEADTADRWRICSAIVKNPPLNINDWVKSIYLSKTYSYSEIGILPLAIIKMFPKDQAREILREGFDHNYRVTPEALGKIGELEDIPFLENKLNLHYDATHVHRDINKAISKIKKRGNGSVK